MIILKNYLKCLKESELERSQASIFIVLILMIIILGFFWFALAFWISVLLLSMVLIINSITLVSKLINVILKSTIKD